jgi:hypothetical protein
MTKECELTSFGRWIEYKRPFKHYRAVNVLDPESYAKISSNFSSILNNSHELSSRYRLSKSNQDYDALMLGITSELAHSFSPFFDVEFLRLIATFLSRPFILRIDGGLHSNLTGSRTGWIHTDFCSGWFDESDDESNMSLFPSRSHCEYFTGKKRKETSKPVEYVRLATLIYYLCNDNWRVGDGGETGLYGASKMTSSTFYDLVPPINNTLLLFECSPHSYHRFVTNPLRTRNSIILWLHSTVEYAESVWGNSINRIKDK